MFSEQVLGQLVLDFSAKEAKKSSSGAKLLIKKDNLLWNQPKVLQ